MRSKVISLSIQIPRRRSGPHVGIIVIKLDERTVFFPVFLTEDKEKGGDFSPPTLLLSLGKPHNNLYILTQRRLLCATF